MTRNGGSLGELSSGTFNSEIYHKKGNNYIYLLPGKVGKIIMTAFRKFGRRPTVSGPIPNRTNFFTGSQALPDTKKNAVALSGTGGERILPLSLLAGFSKVRDEPAIFD